MVPIQGKRDKEGIDAQYIWKVEKLQANEYGKPMSMALDRYIHNTIRF